MASWNKTPKYFNDFKVKTWLRHGLDSLESPNAYEDASSEPSQSLLSQQSPSRKRKRKSSTEDPLNKRERLPASNPLAETTMNPKLPLDVFDPDISGQGQKPIAKRTSRSSPLNQGQLKMSPRKAALTSLTPVGETALPPDSVAFDETEVTVYSSARIPSSSSFSSAFQLADDLILRPGVKSTNTNSSTRSRSSSPVKTMHDLAMAEPPIKFFEAGMKAIEPPEEVSGLYEELLDVCEGFQLLPGSLKHEIQSYSSQYEIRKLRDIYFEARSEATTIHSREELDVWQRVTSIREAAQKCNEDGDFESGWGEMVYSELFKVALRTGHVGWKNITPARIEPKGLCPKHLSGKPLGSKMVDYAMCLIPDDDTHRSILQLLRHLPEMDQNINQTRAAPVRYRPITVNVEVKLPGAGRNETMVQLSIWVAAQFNKLNALSGKRVSIGIPLVSVEGHDWRIYIAYQKENDDIIIWGNDLFGDTSSVLGIYRIIAGIQVLAEWSYTSYRAWFEVEILKAPH